MERVIDKDKYIYGKMFGLRRKRGMISDSRLSVYFMKWGKSEKM